MDVHNAKGTLYIVSTPIGNLEDITFRAVKILSQVDLIAAEDTRKTKILLDHYKISKPMLSYFDFNEKFRASQLIDRLLSGQSVALVSDAGTPGVSDPAYRIVRESIDNGITIVPIPGPSALLAALVVSGLPTNSFVFEGFLPLKKGRKTKLEALKSEKRTIILYESPHRVQKTLRELLEHFGDREVVIGREISKKFEEFIRGHLSGVLTHVSSSTPRGEFVVLIQGNPNPTE
jgi:16S rRNA (cytidine1402-2'-O)-methyltransferase